MHALRLPHLHNSFKDKYRTVVVCDTLVHFHEVSLVQLLRGKLLVCVAARFSVHVSCHLTYAVNVPDVKCDALDHHRSYVVLSKCVRQRHRGPLGNSWGSAIGR